MWTEIILSVGSVLGLFLFVGFFIFCMLIQFIKFAG